MKSNPRLEGLLWDVSCVTHVSTRQQASLSLEMMGKLSIERPDSDALQACPKARSHVSTFWEVCP